MARWGRRPPQSAEWRDYKMDGPWFKFTPLRFAEVTVLMLMAAGSGWAQPNPATFRHPQRFPAGEQPWAAVVADFNHDGKPDAAVADKATGNVDILLNKGNGFSAPVSYATGTSATSIATADFNQDGNQDLAVVGETGFVYILIGSGNGTFQPAT